jgi:hypothetical protein
VDTFTAIPSFRRVPINVIDKIRIDEWMNSPLPEEGEEETPIPTITQIFIVYTKGPGTPVPVQIEVDRIETEYSQSLPSDEDEKNLTTFEYSDKWRRVNMLLRRNLLLAVVDKLDVDDANVLAQADDGEGRIILERAGWLTKRILEENKDVENKEEGEDVTGESTSSISPPSTQESNSRRKK